MMNRLVWPCSLLLGALLSASAPGEEGGGESDGNLSRSAAIIRDRDLERVFEQIDESVKQENWGEVSGRLHSVLERDEVTVVLRRGALRGAASAANEVLERLPREARAAYRRHAQETGQQQLDEALRESDLDRLLAVARGFLHTRAGTAALHAYARAQWDRGTPERARIAFEELRNHAVRPLTGAMEERLHALIGNAAPVERSPGLGGAFPSLRPLWSSRGEAHAEAVETFENGYRDLRESGIAPLSPWTAVGASGRFVTCTPGSLRSLDMETGETIWDRPLSLFGARAFRAPGELSDPNRERNVMVAVLHRMFGDSAYSRVTSDGVRLFLVEPANGRSRTVLPESEEEAAEFLGNRLVCLDGETGEVEWHSDGASLAPFLFAGPPTAHRGRLFVQGESQALQSLCLLELDPRDGSLLNATELAKPLIPSRNDPRRLVQACPVLVQDRSIICPTGAGVVVAVDPLWGEFEWAHRYPRNDARETGPRLNEPDPGLTGFHWWGGWQSVQVLAAGGNVVLATPESETLTSLRSSSGEVAWSAPREDGLYLAAADEALGVIVIGQRQARCFDLSGGELKWTVPIPQPAGFGVREGKAFLFPIGESGTARLDLTTGRLAESLTGRQMLPPSEGSLPDRLVPRNLSAAGGGVFELGPDEIQRLQPIVDPGAGADLDAVPENGGPRSADLLPLLAFERGDVSQGVELFRERITRDEEPETLRRNFLNVLLNGLRESETESAEAALLRRETLVEALQETLDSPAERAVWLHVQVEEAIRQGEWDRVVRLWLKPEVPEVMQEFIALESGRRRCRLSRWIQGEVLRTWGGLPPEEQRDVSSRITRVIEDSDDSAERKRLMHLLGKTPWGRRLTIEDRAEPASREEFIASQLRLLELSSHAEEEVASSAAERLSQWPGQGEEAAGHSTKWPEVTPVVRRKPRHSSDIYFSPIPVRARKGASFERLRAELDWPGGRGVRFSGSAWGGPWLGHLPATTRFLRSEPDLVQGWGMGQLLVLQVGSELIALTPFQFTERNGEAGDERGAKQVRRPDAQILWPREKPVDTLGDRSNLMLSFLREHPRQRPGFPEAPVRRLNEFGRYVTAVGPVRPGYVCLQQKGMLLAVETASGNELWRRYDLPPRALCYGDDEHVVLIESTTGNARLLSSLDGRTLQEFHIERSLEDVLVADGTSLLLATGDPTRFPAEADDENEEETGADQAVRVPDRPVRLELLDLIGRRTVWRREWPAGTIPFEIDEGRLGLLEPEGSIEFIEVSTGETVRRQQLEISGGILRIACSVGPDDFLVVLSKRVDDQKLLTAPQRHRGHRRPFVNGSAFAFDRQSGKLLWERELGNTVFPLDQPDLPVFVTAEGRFPEERMDSGTHGSRIRCFDRRTGEVLYESESISPVEMNYSLDGFREKHLVTLTTRNVTVEIDFAPPPPPDEPPAADENR